MRNLLALLLVFTLWVSLSFADDNGRQQNPLQSIVQRYKHKYGALEKVTAIALTVKQGNQAPISIFSGHTDTSKTTPVNQRSLFQMGSMAKSFVAVIALKLESDPHYGFNLDDKLHKFLPEYSQWSNITIRQLLNMTSGIPDLFVSRHILETWSNQPYQSISPKQWLDQMHEEPLLYQPGLGFNYSNTNYFILGLIIEKLTGKSVEQVIEETLLKPHALHNTYMVMHQLPLNLKQNMVRGYQQEKALASYLALDTDVTDFSLSYLFSAGSVVSNTEDIVRWLDALLNQQQVLTPQEFTQLNQLISQKTGHAIEAVTQHDCLAYGLGVSVHYSPKLHTPIYLYEGITAGYRSYYVYVPKKQLSIVVAVNSSYTGKENHLIALINEVASIIL